LPTDTTNTDQKEIYKKRGQKASFLFNIYYMKFILEYKAYKPEYKEGDVVLIKYWYLDEEDCPKNLKSKIASENEYGLFTPVTINKVLGSGKFSVSHNVDGSPFKGAPDEVISKSKILDHLRKINSKETAQSQSSKYL
jgi:hypothetical protein